jgi:hypothetical protein
MQKVPTNLSYVFIVHAGSYKDFLKKLEKTFPDLSIRFTKRKAIHYYIMEVEEVNCSTQSYDKDTIYSGLPLMAMREEFSNFIFFKGTKGYNNILKIMLTGKENKEAPFELFREMLTVNEKYNITSAYEFDDKKDTDFAIEFTVKERNETTLKEEEKTVTYFGTSTFDEEVKSLMFEANEVKVKGKEYDFLDAIKEEKKLTVGII